MTGLRRTLGLCVVWAAFQTPALAARPDDLSDAFDQVVEMLQRGRRDEALTAMRKLLAMSPDQKAAYELWSSRQYEQWRDLLVEGGDFELGAKRLIMLATAERAVRRNDPAAIGALVEKATTSEDTVERLKAVRQLSGDHGEYAVPNLLALVAEGGTDDRTLRAMHTLRQMGSGIVVPLLAALDSDNPILRRNVLFVLGGVGNDPRTLGALHHAAAHDPDPTVQQAAKEALGQSRAGGDAVSNFLAAGDAYYNKRDTVVSDNDAQDAVWAWTDGRLQPKPIPRALYTSEMSKRQYFAALGDAPNSTEALAGLARAYVDLREKLDLLEKAGVDAGEWKATTNEALQAVNVAGVDALDLALQQAVRDADAMTGAGLAQVLGPLAKVPTPGLQQGLRSPDGAIRSESAVALASVAARTGVPASPEVVAVLGESAGREAVKVVFVVDGDATRSAATAAALEKFGAHVTRWDRGLKALPMLRRAPGVDLIVVADQLPDVTTAQVIDEVRGDDRTAKTPILVLTADAANTQSTYQDKIQGTTSGPEDTQAAQAILAAEMTGDRKRAADLAARSCQALATLALRGNDLSAALGGLTTAAGRTDVVALPALRALAECGGPGQAGTLAAILADEARSEEARIAAGQALSGVLGRHGNALDAEGIAKVRGVVDSQAALTVRQAAAQVVGSLPIGPAERAEMLKKLRG